MTLTAESADIGVRIDIFISEHLNISRSAAQNLIPIATVNEKSVAKNYKLRAGDTVDVTVPEPQVLDAKPQDIPIDIVYEDDYLLVVNKPQGMVVHPAVGNPDGTLVNALAYRCNGRLSSINGVIRPGIVHRIDKDTSGLLIVAKTDEAHKGLAKQIEVHSFIRRYEAIVNGIVKNDTQTIALPIGRHKTDRKKMAVTFEHSRPAVTHLRVIRRYKGYTHVELTLETGRTHQIRVHMAHFCHSVIGDPVYGNGKNEFGLNGQCLVANFISFVHPITGQTLSFSVELPDYFKAVLAELNKRD